MYSLANGTLTLGRHGREHYNYRVVPRRGSGQIAVFIPIQFNHSLFGTHIHDLLVALVQAGCLKKQKKISYKSLHTTFN